MASALAALVPTPGHSQTPPKLGAVPVRPQNRTAALYAALAYKPTARTFGGVVAELARRNLGEGEQGRDNAGPYVDLVSQNSPTVDEPWCAAWVCAMYFFASYALQTKPPWETWHYGADGGIDPELWVPKLVENAKRSGRFVSGRSSDAGRVWQGAVLFVRGGPHGYPHTGIVESADGPNVYAIEGNIGRPSKLDGVGRVVRPIASCDYGLA
jgi:hypothetical protein